MTRILLTVYFLIVIHAGLAFGYDDQITHPEITRKAVRDASSLDKYMKTSLGFEKGVSSRFPSNSQDPKTSAIELLTKGSTDEDHPLCRASNHFHDPLKSWNLSYVGDMPTLFNDYCEREGWRPRGSLGQHYSNITWATGYLTSPPDGAKAAFTYDPERTPNNWDKARAYFIKALTNKYMIDREAAFAQTFQAVGQVMHLMGYPLDSAAYHM